MKSTLKVGQIFTSNKGYKYKIVKYENYSLVTIKFLKSGYIMVTSGGSARSGEVKDLYAPSMQGKGFIGEGGFSSSKTPRVYFLWSAMHDRCSPRFWKTYPSYKDCFVCERWNNLQLFGEDITKMKNWNRKGFQLDKDLTVFGNKEYAPKLTRFVPSKINSLLSMATHKNNKYGLGVVRHSGKYIASCKQNGKLVRKYSHSPKIARKLYAEMRAAFIHETANLYKDVISKKIYRNLIAIKPSFFLEGRA